MAYVYSVYRSMDEKGLMILIEKLFYKYFMKLIDIIYINFFFQKKNNSNIIIKNFRR